MADTAILYMCEKSTRKGIADEYWTVSRAWPPHWTLRLNYAGLPTE